MVRQSAGLIAALAACGDIRSDQEATPVSDLPTPYFLQNTQSPHIFRSEDGRELTHTVGSGLLSNQSESHSTLELWSNWGILQDCVGHPLRPYLADPEATLMWVNQPKGHWLIRYSGLNPCSIEGVVRLDAHRDHVDTSKLIASGSAWSDEGRSFTQTLLQMQLREEAIERYQRATPPGRILLLKRLTEDSKGADALRDLLGAFPLDEADIKNALLRHASKYSMQAVPE